jgi:hypothetical protein
MLKYFESKVKGLNKEDFAVGPMQVPKDLRGSSFLFDDRQQKANTVDPNNTPAQSSVQTIIYDESDDEYVRPSNEYVLVSLSRRFPSIAVFTATHDLDVPMSHDQCA